MRAVLDGQSRWFRARSGVLLACGGFENNPALRRAFLNRPLDLTCGVKTNEGDGHLMGMAIGAQVANLSDAWWQMAARCIDEEGEPVSVHIRAERNAPHSMIVNRHGERFMNEATNYYDVTEPFGTKQNGTPNLPAYLILDQEYRDRYPLLQGAPATPAGQRPEWLVEADSLRELAVKLSIDVDGLERSVARFNDHARAGVDPDFGRGGNVWDVEWGDPTHGPNPSLGTIERGPFYAVEMHAGAMGTKGGLQINTRAEVISSDGLPIPGLYSAGNTSSGAVPHAYAGPGATLGPALTFGYIAGIEMAKLGRGS